MRLAAMIDSDPAIHVVQASKEALEGDVGSLQMINGFDEVSSTAPGALVVLAPSLSADAASYRFDLMLGQLPDGVAGIALSGQPGEPSATSLRTAERRGIPLLMLAPDADVAAIAVRVRDFDLGGDRVAINRLETVCRIVDQHVAGTENLTQLLTRLSAAMDSEVTIEIEGGHDAIALDAGSGQRLYLAPHSKRSDIMSRAALSYAARVIEAILRRDFEQANLGVRSRGELLNEFLLSDVSSGAVALARLRRTGLPVEGHHLAVRIDLHSLATAGDDAADNYRRQLRAARVLIDKVSAGESSWTSAGTNSSVLLVMSEPRHNPGHAEALVSRLEFGLTQLEHVEPGLEWFAGVGTVQSGAAGLRNTADEAYSALRAALAGAITNQLHHFDRLGFARSLIRWYEVDDVRETIEGMLAPLTQLGPKKSSEAVRTLRAYLDSGQNVKVAAHRLHVHRNTVRYRIKRILDVLEVDLNDPEQRLLVELGTRAMRMG